MRKLRLVAAALLIMGSAAVAGVTTSTPALAGTGNQWCYEYSGQACLNAWGGGPYVKIYVNKGVVNNDFTLVFNNHAQAWQLEFTGGGSWNGRCVGDSGNDPNNASTSLDNCGFDGVNIGWGTLFDLLQPGACGGGEYVFKNRHWTSPTYAAYLGVPNNWSNGLPWYLNTSTQNCLYFSPPA